MEELKINVIKYNTGYLLFSIYSKEKKIFPWVKMNVGKISCTAKRRKFKPKLYYKAIWVAIIQHFSTIELLKF